MTCPRDVTRRFVPIRKFFGFTPVRNVSDVTLWRHSRSRAYKGEGPQDGEEEKARAFGGKGTGRNFMCDGIIVPKDINPNVAVHIQNIMSAMKRARDENHSLEAARDMKRSSSDEPSKKRVTAALVMSEQEMFQEEHLKLQKRVAKIEQVLQRTCKILKSVQERLQEHISLDSNGATPVASSTASLGENGVAEKQCGCCDRFISDCKCFDEVYC